MKIIKGKIKSAKKICIYGPEGIGKSTFAAHFPNPLFIDTEGSTKELDVSRFEKPTSWTILQEDIHYVISNPTVCQTLIIDTIDWAEQLCIKYICDKNQKDGIESFGYGAGYVYEKEEFGRFLNLLGEVTQKGINVVLTAHAQIRKFEQPDEMGAYDRWELKLGKKTTSQTSPLVKEWADMLLFANYKTYSVAVDDKGQKRKAQGGKRVMYTSHHVCWDAKNRYGLPEELPLDYAAIAAIIEPGSGAATAPRTAPAPAAPAPGTPAPPKPESRPDATPTGEQMSLPLGREAPPMENDKNSPFFIDEQIPKNLRDLMVSNQIQEEEIQAVIEAQGYVPAGARIRDYDRINPGIIDGLLVAQWPEVKRLVLEAREKQEIPFNNN